MIIEARDVVLSFGETPALRETGGGASGGYGLHLVDRIADDWGVQHASMHVWFDLSY